MTSQLVVISFMIFTQHLPVSVGVAAGGDLLPAEYSLCEHVYKYECHFIHRSSNSDG